MKVVHKLPTGTADATLYHYKVEELLLEGSSPLRRVTVYVECTVCGTKYTEYRQQPLAAEDIVCKCPQCSEQLTLFLALRLEISVSAISETLPSERQLAENQERVMRDADSFIANARRGNA
jgi:hypothetical protein